jgi:hypothetical protein
MDWKIQSPHRELNLLLSGMYHCASTNYATACPRYNWSTEYNWKLCTNFEHEFHIPKQEIIFISACVQKYLITELWLKEYVYNKCSKYPPWDSMHAFDTSHYGPPHPFKDVGAVCGYSDRQSRMRWWSVSSLLTRTAYTRVLRCPYG